MVNLFYEIHSFFNFKYTEYLYNIQNILRENKINSVTVEG
jgi:hypothetical protein